MAGSKQLVVALCPTHLISHPVYILGEVAHLSGQEALTFLQEGRELWAGRNPRNQCSAPSGQAQLAFPGATVRVQG